MSEKAGGLESGEDGSATSGSQRGVIGFFADHPTAANLLMVALFVMGLYAAPKLLRETFPRVDPRRVEVSVVYPGARPEDVEESLCLRIEDAVDGVDNVAEVACEAREGRATAVLEMIEGSDLDRFFSDVKTEIDAISDFPDKAEEPVIRQLGRTDFVASVVVSGPETLPQLKAYAEDVKTRMLRWGGIPKVTIKGFSDHQIRIEVADANLRQFGLSLSDIASAVTRQSVDLPAGSIETREGEILVRFADERKRVHEFADLIVLSGAGGGQVRLGEIAKIEDRFELDEERIVFNGRLAAMLDVTKTENEDTLNVIDAVNGFLKDELAQAPPGVSLDVVNDVSTIVRDRLEMVTTNLLQGLLLVFLTMWLFFGFKYSFWIAMGLPVSFMGAFMVMLALGMSINMLTMVALLIVVGLLMDDAIVISESIATQHADGKTAHAAAVDGTRMVLPGVLASFATTVCVFGSLMYLKGDIGAVLRVVPIVMLCVLVVSLFEAFLILPNHLGHAMEKSSGPSQLQVWSEGLIAWLRDRVVGPFARVAVDWRYLTAGCAVGSLLLAVAAMAGGLLKFTAFPELDGDTLEARILLPQGTPLARTEAVVAQLEAALKHVNERHSAQQPGGGPLVRNINTQFALNKDAHESGPHVATMSVDLMSTELRTVNNDTILSEWRAGIGDLPDVLAVKFTQPESGPGGKDIELRLRGDDLAAVKAASMELRGWFERYKGVHDINDDLRLGKKEVIVRMKEAGTALGLTARDVADQLRTAFYGSTVQEIQVGREAYDIDVRLSDLDKDNLADLDYFSVSAGDGNLVPLSAVASLDAARGYSRINRIDRQRTVTITGDVDKRVANANEVISDMRSRFLPEFLKRHRNVEVVVEGQDKEAGKTQSSMISGFLLGLVGVFLLLSFLFRSYVEPVVVMVVIPLAFVGAVVGHILMGLDFTMPSLLGFVALAGVVVNDSILLVYYIKRHHRPGVSVAQLGPQASVARFRAILLTSLTTIVGLFPILSETSVQAQILVPLVTSLAFGLIASTILVLFVVPAIYAILDDFGLSTLAQEFEHASDDDE